MFCFALRGGIFKLKNDISRCCGAKYNHKMSDKKRNHEISCETQNVQIFFGDYGDKYKRIL